MKLKLLILNPRQAHNKRLAFFRRKRSLLPMKATPFMMMMTTMLPDSVSSSLLLRRILIATAFLFGVSLSSYVLYRAADSAGFRLPDSLDPASSGFFYVFPSSAADIVAPPPVCSHSVYFIRIQCVFSLYITNIIVCSSHNLTYYHFLHGICPIINDAITFKKLF